MLVISESVNPLNKSRIPMKRCWHQSRLLQASHRVSQKYKRAQQVKIQRREYRKLKKIIPATRQIKENVDKMVVVEEAIKYIDELHTALYQRFASGALPKHVLPAAMPIIELLQSGQLPLPPALQQQTQQRHQLHHHVQNTPQERMFQPHQHSMSSFTSSSGQQRNLRPLVQHNVQNFGPNRNEQSGRSQNILIPSLL